MGNVQFLTQGFDRLAFFISADSVDLEFSWIIRWHRITPPFVNNEPIILQDCKFTYMEIILDLVDEVCYTKEKMAVEGQ